MEAPLGYQTNRGIVDRVDGETRETSETSDMETEKGDWQRAPCAQPAGEGGVGGREEPPDHERALPTHI